jgi:hypothetical protein
MPDFDVYGDGFFDVSVINICANSYVERSASGTLEGTNIRYQSKMKKYAELVARIKPLVVESTGGWHRYSMGYWKALSEHISTRTSKLVSSVLNDLMTMFRLQRNQGAMLVRRCFGVGVGM